MLNETANLVAPDTKNPKNINLNDGSEAPLLSPSLVVGNYGSSGVSTFSFSSSSHLTTSLASSNISSRINQGSVVKFGNAEGKKFLAAFDLKFGKSIRHVNNFFVNYDLKEITKQYWLLNYQGLIKQ